MPQYIKLDNLFEGNTLYITGGFHGAAQNNTAMDLKAGNIIAPLDGCKVEYIKGTGGQAYFGIRLPVDGDAVYEFVHGRPTKGVGQTFQKGEVMGVNVPYYNKNGKREDHWHVAIKVNGVWHGALTYIRRNLKLVLLGSPWSNPYDKWSFYKDRTLKVNWPTPVNPTPPKVEQPTVVVPTPPVIITKKPAEDNNTPFTPAPLPEPEKELPEIIAPELPSSTPDPVISPNQNVELPTPPNTETPIEKEVEDVGLTKFQKTMKVIEDTFRTNLLPTITAFSVFIGANSDYIIAGTLLFFAAISFGVFLWLTYKKYKNR